MAPGGEASGEARKNLSVVHAAPGVDRSSSSPSSRGHWPGSDQADRERPALDVEQEGTLRRPQCHRDSRPGHSVSSCLSNNLRGFGHLRGKSRPEAQWYRCVRRLPRRRRRSLPHCRRLAFSASAGQPFTLALVLPECLQREDMGATGTALQVWWKIGPDPRTSARSVTFSWMLTGPWNEW